MPVRDCLRWKPVEWMCEDCLMVVHGVAVRDFARGGDENEGCKVEGEPDVEVEDECEELRLAEVGPGVQAPREVEEEAAAVRYCAPAEFPAESAFDWETFVHGPLPPEQQQAMLPEEQ